MLRIDKIMKEQNISTLQLAELMHVSPQYVSEVVNERKNITLKVLERFAEALDVSIASLLDGYIDKGKLENSSFKCPYCGNIIEICKPK